MKRTIKVKGNKPINDDLYNTIINQPIYWSDDRLCHWFFDFEYNGQWISSKYISNELNNIIIDIF